MTVRELYLKLDKKIPRALSCAWDNDGLMCCPDGDREVRRVLVALDATDEVCRHAIEGGYDMILTHHSLIFKGIKAFEDENAIVAKTIKLVHANIAVMSFHTRLDALEGGVNDTLAGVLGLKNVESFIGEGLPIGRVGEFDAPMSLEDFAGKVKETLGAPFVLVSDSGREVRRVAVVGGDGKDFIAQARALGADTYVSGRFDYHSMTDTPDTVGGGINLIEAGHFFTEHPVTSVLKNDVESLLPDATVTIFSSNVIHML